MAFANLENPNFDFCSALQSVDSKTFMFNSKNGKVEAFPDFGVIIVGEVPWECIEKNPLNPTEEEFVAMMGLEASPAPVVQAPITWKVSDIACKLGMFPSRSQAMKNGFGMEIPNGFQQWFFRVNKMRGVITTFKTFDQSLKSS